MTLAYGSLTTVGHPGATSVLATTITAMLGGGKPGQFQAMFRNKIATWKTVAAGATFVDES